MPPESHILPIPSCYVQIAVEGRISESWSDWLSGLQISSRMEASGRQVTTLSGLIVDQVALRGLLNRLWDLNLALLSVQTGAPGTGTNPE